MNLYDRTAPSMFIRSSRLPAARSRRLAAAAGGAISNMTNTNWSETLEPRQMMSADLGIELSSTYAPLSFYAPGETITIPFVLRNNDIASFTGRAVVGLSLVGTSATSTITQNVTSLAADGTVAGTISYVIPAGFNAGNYTPRLNLTLQTAAGAALTDNDTLDNRLDLRTTDAIVRWAFGNIPDNETVTGRSNVTMLGVDGDGTEYTMRMTGGGFGEFISFGEGIVFNKLELTGVRNAVGPTAQTVTFAYVPDNDLSSNDNIDFDYLLGTASQTAALPNTMISVFTAPAVNFNRGFALGETIGDGVNIPATIATTAITVRNIAATEISDDARIFGNIGAFTAANVGAPLYVTGTTGVFRLTSISNNGELNVGGSMTSLTIGTASAFGTVAITRGDVLIGGNVGAVSIGSIDGSVDGAPDSESTLTFEGSVGAFTVANVNAASILIGKSLPSFTARDINLSRIALNYGNVLDNVAKPFTARNISASVIDAQLSFSTFTAASWTTTAEGFAVTENLLIANSITTMTIGTAGSTVAGNGNFDAKAYIGDRVSRAVQLGTVNVNGILTGSFIVAGSTGAITARVVDSGAYRPLSTGGSPEWSPAVMASGTVLSFNSTDVRSGAVWATSIRTVNLTVISNDRNFEVVAGFKADREAIFTVRGTDEIIYGGGSYQPAVIRSGLIGTLNLTLRNATTTPVVPAVAGFTGRFAAGFDVLQATEADYRSDTTGFLDFALANTNSKLLNGTNGSNGRINAINVTGVLAPAVGTANSLAFAAIDFPTARFNYGTLRTALNGVLVPASNTPPTPGAITIAGTPSAANTFFRVGRLT